MKAIGYLIENPSFIQKGEYKRTDLDDYKSNVDFLVTSCGKRYEIVFNKPTLIAETRSIKRIGQHAYLVTEKALDELKEKYTWATDF